MKSFLQGPGPVGAIFFGCLTSFFLAQPVSSRPAEENLKKIDTFVVIYLENHGFDNLYGLFPGAEGIRNAPRAKTLQVDAQGHPYRTLPRVMDTRQNPHVPDSRFRSDLPNRPFEIGRFAPEGQTGDLTHRFYQHINQIHGGRMDRFAQLSNAGGLVMGYYDGSKLPLWAFAQRYVLADHFFSGTFGGSFLNHIWLACACAPHESDPPKSNTLVLDQNGELILDGAFTSDGYAVNNVMSSFGPRSPSASEFPDHVLAPQRQPTLGDRLSDKGIEWAWYAGGWRDAVLGKPDPTFQFHHQPYTYFERYREGSLDRERHLRDGEDFFRAIREGTLPRVSFYEPIGKHNEHPGLSDLFEGERHVADLLRKLEKSPQWPRMMIIVTYDEYGGYWDHVPPPRGDRFGPGTRVPSLIISPLTRGGGIDSTVYDTSSILKTIEVRFGLEPLGERDARANSLARSLNRRR